MITVKVSVGRTVHYVSYGSPVQPDGSQKFKAECRAAIVTAVQGDYLVSLAVLNPSGLFFQEACHHADVSNPLVGGTWHWPERVD